MFQQPTVACHQHNDKVHTTTTKGLFLMKNQGKCVYGVKSSVIEKNDRSSFTYITTWMYTVMEIITIINEYNSEFFL